MKVRMLMPWNIYNKGDVIDTYRTHADVLVMSGVVEYVKPMGEIVRPDAAPKLRGKPRAA